MIMLQGLNLQRHYLECYMEWMIECQIIILRILKNLNLNE